MANYKVVGQRLPRVDGAEKATGRAIYGADVQLPGLLYGKVLRSPYAHARILRVDTDRAERIPGVKAVLTLRDVPQHRIGQFICDYTIFAKDKVRYVGDEIAAVAAVDEETAQEAVEAIEVDYEELPAVLNIEDTIKPGAPLIHEDMTKYELAGPQPATYVAGTNRCAHYELRKGEPERGFQESDYIFEDIFRTHSFHHGYLEPHACVASVDSSGRVTVWTSTQRPFEVRAYICSAFNLPSSKVRVLGIRVGGGFGGKARPRFERFPVALSMKAGLPVKMVMTREEDFMTYRAPAAHIKLKVGAKRDGLLMALVMEIIWDMGAYSEAINYVMGPLDALPGPYAFQHLKIDSYGVNTNRMPSYAYRGRIMPQPTFALESAMDMIAEKLGMDPLDFRMKNLFEEGSINASGHVLRSVGIKECVEKAAAAIGWGRKPGPNRGIALVSFHKYPPPPFLSSAAIRLNEDGTVRVECGAPDIGQGSQTVLSQIAAEELGVRLEDVSLPLYDTDLTPFEAGAIADRLTPCAGNAVRMAAAQVREQTLGIAAEMLKVEKGHLTIEDGRVFVKEVPEIGISLAEVCAEARSRIGGPIIGEGTYERGSPLMAETGTPEGISPVWKYGAQAAEVEVDPETGMVKVHNLVCAQDVGKAINPLSLEGQMDGAALMGLGLAVYEETLFDSTGRVVNPNFMDYRIPTVLDSVKIDRIIVEETSPDGPFGAKGAGEQGTVGVAPVVANAIYYAVGVRLKELPFTPQTVLSALKAKEGERQVWMTQGGAS